MQYQATTDQLTVFNPTQHSYFNLAGTSDENVLDHRLTLYAKHYLPLKTDGMPSGKIDTVINTVLDFSNDKRIGEDIFTDDEQLIIAKGYDHYFLQDKVRGDLSKIATLSHQKTGRSMEVWTTELGAQVYSANYLSSEVIGADQVPMQKHQGICIETGQYPNAPVEKNFPLVQLSPQKKFVSETIFKFKKIT